MIDTSSNIALLIDADNASFGAIRLVIHKLEEYGAVNIRRAYGNWEKTTLTPWKPYLLRYAIRPIQQYDYTKGKNATDIALTIDAMALSYEENIQTFAIVSSDSDFTPLSMHLRERGLTVYGFGSSKTPRPFAHACSQFFCLPDKATIRSQPASKSSSPSIVTSTSQASISAPEQSGDSTAKSSPQTQTADQVPGIKLKQNTKLIQTLRTVIQANQNTEGWCPLSPVGSQTKIQPKQYGYSKLSSLLKEIDLFEVKQINTVLMVRCVSSKT